MSANLGVLVRSVHECPEGCDIVGAVEVAAILKLVPEVRAPPSTPIPWPPAEGFWRELVVSRHPLWHCQALGLRFIGIEPRKLAPVELAAIRAVGAGAVEHRQVDQQVAAGLVALLQLREGGRGGGDVSQNRYP